ncbi:type III secretion system (T3SS) SseB-like protein [Branchiibius hedensis]|uniref:SseB protein N-terminal domain-containing protein n=1 Tax=Branchiibius hedensis TaxID=672460 RepID=A0A2Y8ZWG3_9MICO|nr:SseB family protein [Branchiibius hedensis]PWJ25414.1 type III secretion system (T3SS) SseB-like protein [Branchiibius hedensis]SSA34227.1 SseB protein N-terminal domain-containing protein [Branchiibius hedensis]
MTDSAGLPWGGREVTDTGFGADDGSADPALRASLTQDERCWMSALADARVLVPVVATEEGRDEHGGDKAASMATVIVQGPQGERALPVFTGLDSLAAWSSDARPSPVLAPVAARAAISEQCDVLVVDPGTATQVVVRPSMLWALAQQQDWLPAHADPFVAEKVRVAVRDLDAVVDVTLEDGSDVGPGVLRLGIVLAPGLTQEQVQKVATTIGERLATDGEVRARIDGLTFALRAATTPATE